MAKPFSFQQAHEAQSSDDITVRGPGNTPALPLPDCAVQLLGHLQSHPTYSMRFLGPQCIERFAELKPNARLDSFVSVPCITASGKILAWTKKEANNDAFNSWTQGILAANGKPQFCHYDESNYRYVFNDAPAFDIQLPKLSQEEFIAFMDSISINNPDSDEFAEFLKLFD